MTQAEFEKLVEFLAPEATKYYRDGVALGHVRPAVFVNISGETGSRPALNAVRFVAIDLIEAMKRFPPDWLAKAEKDLCDLPTNFFPLLINFESGGDRIAGVLIPDLD
jgi:hypothetical protein